MFDLLNIRRSSEKYFHDFARSTRCLKLRVIDAVTLIQLHLRRAIASGSESLVAACSLSNGGVKFVRKLRYMLLLRVHTFRECIIYIYI